MNRENALSVVFSRVSTTLGDLVTDLYKQIHQLDPKFAGRVNLLTWVCIRKWAEYHIELNRSLISDTDPEQLEYVAEQLMQLGLQGQKATFYADGRSMRIQGDA